MTQTLIRWRLAEVMARHKVSSKDLALELDISSNAVGNLKSADTMPRIDGKRLEQICDAISKLSRISERVSPHDLLEWKPEDY